MENIIALIVSDEIEEALNALEPLVLKKDKIMIILWKSEWNNLKRQILLGTLSENEIRPQKANLKHRMLEFTQELESKREAAKQKILFLAASPTDKARTQSGREYRKIKEEIAKGDSRDSFEFINPDFDVTVTNLIREFGKKPSIIHFSGHGKQAGILIADENTGEAKLLSTNALERLFKNAGETTKLVLLNCCFSAEQAKVISQFGMYVVGNNAEIEEQAAIAFAQGLYTALSEGHTFENAFNAAMIAIEVENSAYTAVIEVWRNGAKMRI